MSYHQCGCSLQGWEICDIHWSTVSRQTGKHSRPQQCLSGNFYLIRIFLGRKLWNFKTEPRHLYQCVIFRMQYYKDGKDRENSALTCDKARVRCPAAALAKGDWYWCKAPLDALPEQIMVCKWCEWCAQGNGLQKAGKAKSVQDWLWRKCQLQVISTSVEEFQL